jgi:hypothetical protein
MAGRTALAGIRRVDILGLYSNRFRLILDKCLQLPESPTVKPGWDSPASLKGLSDIGQILHPDNRPSDRLGVFHNRPAGFVIILFDSTPHLAGDFAKQLFGTWRAFGLQAVPKARLPS